MPRLLPLLLLPALAACPGSSTQPGTEVLGRFTLEGTLALGRTDCVQVLTAPDGGLDAGQDAGPPQLAGVAVPRADGSGPDGGVDFPLRLPPVPITLTGDADGGPASLLLRGEWREDAGYDGRVFTSVDETPRRFPAACGQECTGVRLRETLAVALLSGAQVQAAGGGCPEAPLDGGVPAAADAGEAQRVCGELLEEVLVPEGCECRGCRAVYRVQGGT